MTTLGKEIKKARIDRDLSQEDLLALLGGVVSQKYLSQVENDLVDPRWSLACGIAAALKVRVGQLAGEERA